MLDILEKIEKKNSLKNFAYIKGDKKFTYLDLSIRIHLIKEAIISKNIKNNRIGIFLSQGLDYGASLFQYHYLIMLEFFSQKNGRNLKF